MATSRTVREIIEAALRKLGTYAPGETVSADDMDSGLMAFNDLLSEWAADGVTVPSVVQEAITLVNGQATYTVGEDSADLDTPRPDQIISAFVRSGDHDYNVRIIGEEAFNLIGYKSVKKRPEYLWYNPTAPNGTVNVYGTPTEADSLYITSFKTMKDEAILADDALDVGIPRNYHNPLVFNLAVDLAPEFGVPVTNVIIQRATDGKAAIENLNAANRVQAAQIEFAKNSHANDDLVRY